MFNNDYDYNYDEAYFDGDLESDSDYGISVYDISQLDWALEESCWNNPVKEVL